MPISSRRCCSPPSSPKFGSTTPPNTDDAALAASVITALRAPSGSPFCIALITSERPLPAAVAAPLIARSGPIPTSRSAVGSLAKTLTIFCAVVNGPDAMGSSSWMLANCCWKTAAICGRSMKLFSRGFRIGASGRTERSPKAVPKSPLCSAWKIDLELRNQNATRVGISGHHCRYDVLQECLDRPNEALYSGQTCCRSGPGAGPGSGESPAVEPRRFRAGLAILPGKLPRIDCKIGAGLAAMA